ncbi:hypothetical protein ACFQYP_36935 [Nonomuraea antimicrobica]
MISGLYQGQDGDSRLALRVDVDGPRPTGRVSGDLFTVTGATTSYAGSFVVGAPGVRDGRIEGRADFTFAAPVRDVRVTIADGAGTAEVAGRTYAVSFVSAFFRSVLLEQDSVAGTVPFVSYRTGALPGPASSPARGLSVRAAYAEAGVELTLAEPG